MSHITDSIFIRNGAASQAVLKMVFQTCIFPIYLRLMRMVCVQPVKTHRFFYGGMKLAIFRAYRADISRAVGKAFGFFFVV